MYACTLIGLFIWRDYSEASLLYAAVTGINE